MTNTTDIICDDDYREKYERIKIVIIVCATIFGLLSLFSVIFYYKKKIDARVYPGEFPNQDESKIDQCVRTMCCIKRYPYSNINYNSAFFNNFVKELNNMYNDFSSRILLHESIREEINLDLTKQCCICLEKIDINKRKCTLSCNHECHKYCLIEWLKHENNYCPVCLGQIIN